MVTVKITGALMIVVSGAMIGMMMAEKQRRRISSTERAILFLLTIRQRLGYSMMRTSELLQSACEEIYGYAGGDILDTVAGKYLSDDDARIISDAFSLIGRSDINTQENQLTEFIARLQSSLDSAKGEMPIRQRLSLTLGTMAGLCIAILLI